jgi:hypothetical protein
MLSAVNIYRSAAIQLAENRRRREQDRARRAPKSICLTRTTSDPSVNSGSTSTSHCVLRSSDGMRHLRGLYYSCGGCAFCRRFSRSSKQRQIRHEAQSAGCLLLCAATCRAGDLVPDYGCPQPRTQRTTARAPQRQTGPRDSSRHSAGFYDCGA